MVRVGAVQARVYEVGGRAADAWELRTAHDALGDLMLLQRREDMLVGPSSGGAVRPPCASTAAGTRGSSRAGHRRAPGPAPAGRAGRRACRRARASMPRFARSRPLAIEPAWPPPHACLRLGVAEGRIDRSAMAESRPRRSGVTPRPMAWRRHRVRACRRSYAIEALDAACGWPRHEAVRRADP